MGRYIISVLCEGNTECNFITKLNIFLRDTAPDKVLLISEDMGGVNTLPQLQKKIRKHYKDQFRGAHEIMVWIDYDVFQRKNISQKELHELVESVGTKKSPKLILNHTNGEDLLILFEVDSIIKKWQKICEKYDHFNDPMNKDEYLDRYKSIVPDYKKGRVDVDITRKSINDFIAKSEGTDHKFKSDISKLLRLILSKITLTS